MTETAETAEGPRDEPDRSWSVSTSGGTYDRVCALVLRAPSLAFCVAVAMALVVLLTPLRTWASPAPLDTGALLREYEPVLFFHPQEDWAPESADSFVGRARVERQVGKGRWSAMSPPLPTSSSGCTLSPCFRFNLPCPLRGGDGCYEATRSDAAAWQHPLVYGRVVSVPTGTAPPPGFTVAPRYLVRYWLFYEFDDWRTNDKHLWQAHEGDWENITIALSSTLDPLFAAYSEHCSGTIRAWTSVAKRGGSHPVAYVARGSHANYFTTTATSTKFSECLTKYLDRPALTKATAIIKLAQERLVDRMGTAHPSGPGEIPGVTQLQLQELGTDLPAWARFPGRWSEGQLLWLGATPRSLTSITEGSGPATPNWTATSIPSFWHLNSS
jgi:hypothetical protein